MSPIEKAQRVFRVYRLTLSSVLLLTYFFSTDNALLTIYRAELFLLVAVIWFAAVVVSGISRLIVRQDFVVTTTGNFLIDCVAICLLGYACEGLSSGLYSLLVPTTILAGLSLPRRWTLLIAAVASLGTLLAHSLLTLEAEANASGFVPAGILGVLIFLMGLAANFVSANLRTSIKAAEASARDSQRLRALNESIIARMDTGVMVVEPDGIISVGQQHGYSLTQS